MLKVRGDEPARIHIRDCQSVQKMAAVGKKDRMLQIALGLAHVKRNATRRRDALDRNRVSALVFRTYQHGSWANQ